MMNTMFLAFALFVSGMLTILLPCILPLVPIVLGVSVAGRSRWRPLLVVIGMIVSFVAFTFVLHFVLNRFIVAADLLRTATFAVLLLFGVGFLTESRYLRLIGAVAAALFFLDAGIVAVLVAAAASIAATEAAGRIATRVQQLGADTQSFARALLGPESPMTALLIGLTLGLVWVPCAGPALGFAFSLVRDEPGVRAAFLLAMYAAGTGVPLLLVGYGGQRAVRSMRLLHAYTGLMKRGAGLLLILTAFALHLRTFERLQVWFVDNTPFGDLGTRVEEFFVGDLSADRQDALAPADSSGVVLPPHGMKLPRIVRAPDWTSIAQGPWHGSLLSGSGQALPLTAADLKGKVVLVDFWTYSCINCIRTLPYIEGYWKKYGSTRLPTGENAFVLVGVHTPEFAFEGVPENVEEAIKRHGLTYPVVQDNDYAIWQSFANRYWPAKYLIDADGYVRYTHFGEGGYEETDEAIASLLGDIGVDTSAMPAIDDTSTPRFNDQTPETYLGARSWPALVNQQGDPDDKVVSYVAPATLPLHRYALVGDWQLDATGERQVLRSQDGEIRMRWQGSQIHLVLGLEDGAAPATAEVWTDGTVTKTFVIDHDDLFTLSDVPYGEHDLVLKISGKGAEAYAFTFGS